MVLVIVLGCLGWVASRVEFEALTAQIVDFQTWVLAGVALLYFGIYLMRVRRAQLLLPEGLRWAELAPLVAVGFFANAVVPLRLGVLVRPWLMERRLEVPFGVAVSGAITERVLDVVMLLGLLGAAAAWASPSEEVALFEAARQGLMLAAFAGVAGLGAIMFVPESVVERLLEPFGRLGSIGERLASLVSTLAKGGRGLAMTPLRTIEAVGLSFLMWFAGMLSSAMVMLGFDALDGVAPVLGFWAAVMAAAASAPTPASVGPFEAAGTAALEAYGVNLELAAAITIVMHIAMFSMNVIIGSTAAAMMFFGDRRGG